MSGHRILVIVSIYLSPSKKLLRSDIEALLALGDAVILFGDFNYKNTNWGCAVTNPGDWKRLSTALEEVDTSALNNIPDVIETTDEIDSSLGALTNHIRTVVKRCSRVVPASVDHRKLPADALELLRAKNATLSHAYAYLSRENKSRARALQRHVRARMIEVKNEEWSNLMEDIFPTHQAFWKITRALKSEGYLHTPPLKKPDSSLAVDDQEKAERIADNIVLQRSHTLPPHDSQHITFIEEEVRHKTSLDPLDDLSPVSLHAIQKIVKELKAKKAPGLDGNKAIKYFPLTLLSLLVAIFNACLKNCYFPPVWKEADVIGNPKPGKPRDLPASYRPISLLSGLGKLYGRILKTRLSEYLFDEGLLINEEFGFRPNHSCPQQALHIVEYIREGFKTNKRTVAVFFDVAKIFDRVWHAGLIYKLYLLKVPDRLILIMNHYLAPRHFILKHENTHSRLARVIFRRYRNGTQHLPSPPEGHRGAGSMVPNLEDRGKRREIGSNVVYLQKRSSPPTLRTTLGLDNRMDPTRAGVPVTSCAEGISLKYPQGKSRAVSTPVCCPAAYGEAE
ncbi:Probable RNA-directed DNA polymerase from transposon BS [Eumeta japonica]|uniref:Probable RNA-directed DNA polymerase from transposon BS n=1 Tax=Eumeta variegata TaxID=151549 RepID=A0A4C1TZ28_EUMVA|nr:Probable RNA-directed DNA polymerase from transposon BS [Eumeta japonica]